MKTSQERRGCWGRAADEKVEFDKFERFLKAWPSNLFLVFLTFKCEENEINVKNRY